VTASSRRSPGIVVGLRAEARLVAAVASCEPAHEVLHVRCAFGDAKQATALVDSGAPALVSFGLAGGLDPNLAPVKLDVADSVELLVSDVLGAYI